MLRPRVATAGHRGVVEALAMTQVASGFASSQASIRDRTSAERHRTGQLHRTFARAQPDVVVAVDDPGHEELAVRVDRRDTSAADDVVLAAHCGDAAVADASAVAQGRLGSPVQTRALRMTRSTGPPTGRS